MNVHEARRLKVGDLIRVNLPGMGEVDFSDLEGPPENFERAYPAGTFAVVTALDEHPAPQSFAVTIVIIEGPARWVVNVFDEADDWPLFPFDVLTGTDLDRARQLRLRSQLDLETGDYDPEQLDPPPEERQLRERLRNR